jgi:phage/conjugal plasmid C-4 type zinc finger TraR family protein
MSRLEDMATDVEMADREAAIALAAIARARRAKTDLRPDGVSAKLCACGANIPKARRKALPGVRQCIDCARDKELLNRRFRDGHV